MQETILNLTWSRRWRLHQTTVKRVYDSFATASFHSGQRHKDAREAADYLRRTVREQRVLITLEAPEPISSRGHHVPMPWWQHSVLVNTALVEDGETRLRRDRMRASSSNTTADSYWHGHLHSAYV